jgi:hypothetical protein
MKKVRDRIFKNWKTTLAACFFAILATILIYTNKASFTEVLPLYIASFIGFGLKDSVFESNKNIKFLIPFVFVVFAGCRTPEQKLRKLINENPYLLSTTKQTITDTFYFKQFDTIEKIFTDSILIGDTITIEKENIKVQTFYKDKYIYTTLEIKADTIYKNIEVESRVVELKELDFWEKYKVPIVAVLIIVGVLFITSFKK